jgi:transcription antitermination factor NusG
VYPGYVFVKVEEDTDLHGPVSLPVRAAWVKFGGQVEVVPNRVIEELKRLAGNGELVREVKYINPYRAGVCVRVHLPVYDIAGIVIKMVRGNRVEVETSLCRVTVPMHTLEVM